ncbi:MAG: hypothetical protein RIT27_1787 [Pseudomonadota bacterium]|jgi:diguanylate cyclase (GGDEF)-like protein/PAS domain S-box-containing protein
MKTLDFIKMISLIIGLSLPTIPAHATDSQPIKIGIISQPPLFFTDAAGYVQGFYVDLLEDFKQREKLNISYSTLKIEEVRAKLENNEIDIAFGLEQTPELTTQLDFSKQHINVNWGVVYVHELYGPPIHTVFDLHNKTIAIKTDDPKGIALKKYCFLFRINCSFETFDSYRKVLEAVTNQIVDAGVTNNFQSETDTKSLWKTPMIFDVVELKAAITKGKNPQLLDKIDRYLEKTQKTPGNTLHQIQSRWLSPNLGTASYQIHPSELKREIKQWLPSILTALAIVLLIPALIVYLLTNLKFRRKISQMVDEKNRLQIDENKYRNLVENVPYGFEELSLDGTILFANTAAHHIRRYNYGELNGKSIIDMIADDEQKKAITELLNLINKDPPERLSNTSYPIIRKDNKMGEIRVEWHYKLDIQGRPIGLYTAITDITGLRETKDKIKNYHSDLKKTADERAEELKQVYNDLLITAAVFENTAEGILVIGLEGEIQTVNPAFSKITGYDKENIVEKPLNLLTSPKQHIDFFGKIKNNLEQKGSWQGELMNRRQNGQNYPAWLSLNAVQNAHGVATQYVALLSDITKRKQTEYQIWKQANFDALTQLPNRHLFHQRLAQAITHASNKKTLAALMFIDLDHFKQVNDTLGHDAGDELLIQVTQRLSNSIRKGDTVARMGGDEFTVILPEMETADIAKKIAQQILVGLNQSFQLKLGEVHISGSIGIVVYPDDGQDITTLLKKADIAMYKIKEHGRNGFYFYTDLPQTTDD